MRKIILPIIMLLFLIACDQKEESKTNRIKVTSMEEITNKADGEKIIANIETNMGSFEIELFADDAPKTVENFAGLAMKGYYDGIIFHRVIDQFMIQGGDPTGTGMGGESFWGGKFEDEFKMHLKHDEAGVLSMANAGPNTNGSQFFITLVPTPHLNGRHTVFGKVVKGLEVVKAIGKVETAQGDRPTEDVVMKSVTIEKTTA